MNSQAKMSGNNHIGQSAFFLWGYNLKSVRRFLVVEVGTLEIIRIRKTNIDAMDTTYKITEEYFE